MASMGMGEPNNLLNSLTTWPGFRGMKLGPGALGNLAVVVVAAMICAALAVWALSSQPMLAFIALLFILGFALYFSERSFRFAEKYPAAALMGGAEFYHYLRDQSAKDKSIVVDGPLLSGGPATDQAAIEHLRDDGDA